jgi:TolB protein
VAYVSKVGEGEVIHVMDTDGKNDHPLTSTNQRAIHPSWSADSRSIIYCTDDDLHPPKKNTAEVYAIALKTKAIRVIIAGGVNTYPNYSPDGRRIAFRKMIGETNSEIFVANADGSRETNLTNDPAFDGWPAWSPDGSRIAFASNRDGNYKIYVMNADGSHVRLIANTEGRGTAPQWTKNDERIFFTVCRRIDKGVDCEIFAGKP